MGYQTNNILQNLDTILLFIIGIVIISIITVITDLILSGKPRMREKFKTVYDTVFFGMIFRMLMESYIEMTLSATMNLTDVNSFISNLFLVAIHLFR